MKTSDKRKRYTQLNFLIYFSRFIDVIEVYAIYQRIYQFTTQRKTSAHV